MSRQPRLKARRACLVWADVHVGFGTRRGETCAWCIRQGRRRCRRGIELSGERVALDAHLHFPRDQQSRKGRHHGEPYHRNHAPQQRRHRAALLRLGPHPVPRVAPAHARRPVFCMTTGAGTPPHPAWACEAFASCWHPGRWTLHRGGARRVPGPRARAGALPCCHRLHPAFKRHRSRLSSCSREPSSAPAATAHVRAAAKSPPGPILCRLPL